MRISYIFVPVFCIFLAGCGGGSERSAAGNNAARAGGKGEPAVAGNPAATPSSSPAAAPNAPANADSLMANRNRKIDAMRQTAADPNVPKVDIEQLLLQSARPAPENSEFSVALTDIVVERRIFRDHPVLGRVEKVSNGDRSKLTITTADGRVIERPGSAIENLSVASAASIAKAAGLSPPPPPAPVERKPGVGNRN